MLATYPPAQGCDEALNNWCDRHADCPHVVEHGALLARFDRQFVPGLPKAWRCYARSTLDENESSYVSGKAYCTREKGIDLELRRCLASREAAASEAATSEMAAAVDATGAVQQHSPSNVLGAASSADEHGAGNVPPAGPIGEPRIGLVVAHCHESMAWLGDVQRGLRAGASPLVPKLELHIYEKCGSVPMLCIEHNATQHITARGVTVQHNTAQHGWRSAIRYLHWASEPRNARWLSSPLLSPPLAHLSRLWAPRWAA